MNQTESYFSTELTQSNNMTLDSLSESSLVRLEQYLSSNPYREYSMAKPYFPKPSHATVQTNRLINQQQPSILAFHELIDTQKNSLTLDRLAYKLRMKSDLNIDTLRETHLRRRTHHHHHHHRRLHHPHPSHNSSNISDSLSSIPPSTSTKSFGRQPTSITMSTNTMKTLMTDDLNGVEGSAVRVGTLNDLIKQFRRAEFRLVRRPADYLDSSSTYLSSTISTNDRPTVNKPQPQPQQQQQTERPVKQPQALTEYRFNAPTFPTTPSRTARDPNVHQGLIYQYRTRERSQPTDLPLLHPRTVNSPELQRPRLNSLVVQERQSTAMSSHERRIQELREKSLMRTEKQLCVCNKLNIIDPFNSNSEQSESTLPQLYQTQQQSTVNYIFPPVRPFGYLTKKSTDEPNPPATTQQQIPKKKRKNKKKHLKNSKNSLDSLDKLDLTDNNDDEEDNSQLFNETIQSMVSLTDLDETHNKTINIDLNLPVNFTPNANETD